MSRSKATRNPTDIKDVVNDSTCFQLHKSQLSIFNDIQDKIIDYTEHKLLHYIECIEDPQQRAVLMSLIDNYKNGTVAIAWKRSRPIWVNVTKDS